MMITMMLMITMRHVEVVLSQTEHYFSDLSWHNFLSDGLLNKAKMLFCTMEFVWNGCSVKSSVGILTCQSHFSKVSKANESHYHL